MKGHYLIQGETIAKMECSNLIIFLSRITKGTQVSDVAHGPPVLFLFALEAGNTTTLFWPKWAEKAKFTLKLSDMMQNHVY
jgi:hypothetical protein